MPESKEPRVIARLFALLPDSVLASAAKSTCTTVTDREFIYEVELHLCHGDDDQLGDTLHRHQVERVVSAIPDGDEYLPLIVGVDEADQIAQHDAVFVT